MQDIDCVILWVDGGDKHWLELKNSFLGDSTQDEIDAEAERFRDLGILKYLFRGIESFAPWFRKVFFVTCGQRPEWLNTNCPNLEFVCHEDFIPKEYLPTFNANTIELNLHRIKGLSEQFVYFNDDMFILDNVKPQDFFKDGYPCDSAVLNAFAIKKTEKEFPFFIPLNDVAIINKYFDKNKVIKRYFNKFFNIRYGSDVLRTICLTPWRHFTGFVNYHLPYSLSKETFYEIWEKEYNTMHETCLHKFRHIRDVNIWLLLYWQYVTGKFTPRKTNIGSVLALCDDDMINQMIEKFVITKKRKLICINDNINTDDYNKIQKNIQNAFEQILPEKSKFEL